MSDALYGHRLEKSNAITGATHLSYSSLVPLPKPVLAVS